MGGYHSAHVDIYNVTHCKDGDNFWNGKGNGDFFAGRGEKKPHQGMVRQHFVTPTDTVPLRNS